MSRLIILLRVVLTLVVLAIAALSYVALAVPPAPSKAHAEGKNQPRPEPTPTLGTLNAANFENIAFLYDVLLAKAVTPQVVPGMTDPFVPFDTYRFDFQGYAVDTAMPPSLWVFGASAPESIYYRERIQALKEHLAGRTDPSRTLPVYFSGPGANGLVLPMFVPVNALPVLSTQWKAVNGVRVRGLRFVTFYSQGINPVDANALVYAYSGLNVDGTVAFTAAFPVRTAAPLNLTAPDLKTLDMAKVDVYNQKVADQIARLGTADFVPDLRVIDQVMSSLKANGPLPATKSTSVSGVLR